MFWIRHRRRQRIQTVQPLTSMTTADAPLSKVTVSDRDSAMSRKTYMRPTAVDFVALKAGIGVQQIC